MFDEDDLILISNLKLPENNVNSLEKFGRSFEDLYDFEIFSSHPHLSEVNQISGFTDILLESQTPTINLFTGDEIKNTKIVDGLHHLFFEKANVNIYQENGDSIIFINNIEESIIDGYLAKGNMQIYLTGEENSANFRIINDEIFLGESRLNLNIQQDPELSSTIRLVNLSNGNELNFDTAASNIIKVPENSLSEIFQDIDESNIQDSIDESIKFLSEDNGDLLLVKRESSIDNHEKNDFEFSSNFKSFNFFSDGLDLLFLETSQNKLEIQKMENTNDVQTKNELKLEDFVDFRTYSDFEWNDAIEIIEDL